MDSVRGACSVDKVSGLVSIREDTTPLTLEWNAIDQLRKISVPLQSLTNLQATKDGLPNMMLKVLYTSPEGEMAFKLKFTNRPTMNNIKDSLQTIVARLRTVIKDGLGSALPPPAPPGSAPQDAAVQPGTTEPPVSASSLSDPALLSDAALLRNHQLQQKLLLEDRELRTIFTQSVMQLQLSPAIFWSTRLSQLRTYALTISQQRGRYNVLSTIRPVASSDNQVNVNVTRDTIKEIFDTYPVAKKAFMDLVPAKFPEGEFWSRFFNSRLFRRLRGDRVNNNSNRGDAVLDQYLYIDQKHLDNDASNPNEAAENHQVRKTIDILGNEDDNSQKLGNRPDHTMRFSEDPIIEPLTALANRSSATPANPVENEMIILMKNMNTLSSKMVSINDSSAPYLSDPNVGNEIDTAKPDAPLVRDLYDQEELDLNDLHEVEDPQYIRLDLNFQRTHSLLGGRPVTMDPAPVADPQAITNFVTSSTIGNLDLTDTYRERRVAIEKTSGEINNITRQNFRSFKIASMDFSDDNEIPNFIPHAINQEIIVHNMTAVEFLSHFWKLFLLGNNPGQLKKLYQSVKKCQADLALFRERALQQLCDLDLVRDNTKAREKLTADFNACIAAIDIPLEKACNEYASAVRAERMEPTEVNSNGKRPMEA